MRKCAKCGAEISEDCLRCPECSEVQQLFEYSDKEQAELTRQDLINEQKRKKTRKITIISIVCALIAIIMVLLFAVFKLPQRYFGKFFSAPSSSTMQNPEGEGLIFNFDKTEFRQRNSGAVDLLRVDKNQHRVTTFELIDEDFVCSLYDIDSIHHQYSQDFPFMESFSYEMIDGIDYYVSVYEQKESGKLAGFQWGLDIDEKDKDYRDEVMKNNIRVVISMLNPELGIIRINKLTKQLLESEEYSENRIKALHYNNVCYLLSKDLEEGLYLLSVYPMTHDDYVDLIG